MPLPLVGPVITGVVYVGRVILVTSPRLISLGTRVAVTVGPPLVTATTHAVRVIGTRALYQGTVIVPRLLRNLPTLKNVTLSILKPTVNVTARLKEFAGLPYQFARAQAHKPLLASVARLPVLGRGADYLIKLRSSHPVGYLRALQIVGGPGRLAKRALAYGEPSIVATRYALDLPRLAALTGHAVPTLLPKLATVGRVALYGYSLYRTGTLLTRAVNYAQGQLRGLVNGKPVESPLPPLPTLNESTPDAEPQPPSAYQGLVPLRERPELVAPPVQVLPPRNR